jgi:hypothetical protein
MYLHSLVKENDRFPYIQNNPTFYNQSRVGSYAVGHGIGGIDIPAKMARLAKSLSRE